jgi:hypothetical protein
MENTKSQPISPQSKAPEPAQFQGGSVDKVGGIDHSPLPWEFTYFSKPDGSDIKTIEDVAETTAASALKSRGTTLWGVTLPELAEDGSVNVICYTGNGPHSEANARLIAAAVNALNITQPGAALSSPSPAPVSEVFDTLKAIYREAVSWHSVHGHTENSVQCDSICALIPRMKAALKLSPSPETPKFHMYVWTKRAFFHAVAQATSVTEARELLLEEIGGGDGSCPEREHAAKLVRELQPSIFHRSNAEFCLTDSAELREMDAYTKTLQDKIAELMKASPSPAKTEVEVERERCRLIVGRVADSLAHKSGRKCDVGAVCRMLIAICHTIEEAGYGTLQDFDLREITIAPFPSPSPATEKEK